MHGCVQVEDFVRPDAAERLHQCLAHELPRTPALRYAQGSRPVPTAENGARARTSARGFSRTPQRADAAAFRLADDSYMMVAACKDGRDPELPLHRVLEFLNTMQCQEFCRVLTADARIRRVNAQAARYRAGQFLRQHGDED